MSDEQMKKFAEKTIQWFMDWVAQGRKEMSYTIPPGPWGEDCVSFVNDRLRDAGYTPSWSDWSSPGSLYEALTREVWPAFPSNVYRWAQRFTSLPLMPAPALYPYVIAQYRVVSSLDPNDKSGLPGTGTARFVTPSVTIPYVVQFENKKSATAPAQGVTITDQLDIAKLDLDTFSLGTISFGNRRVTPPAGVANYSTIVDLRPTDNLLVRIDASLDKTTGVLRWTFASLDPATNVPTSDSLAGFLPSGAEGSVLFTVNAKQGLTTGTEIRNQASIVFDVNPPIDTPVWLNTIDNTAPTSKVSPLPATQASANVAVRWTGSDIGSGVQDFTIYISDNGGPFAAWQSNTTATTATLAGTNGHTYRFYSVARDLVGNVEGAKSAAEAITTVVATVPGDVNSDGKVDCADIAIVQAAFGKKTGQPGWDARADVVPDGVIDVRDLSYVSQRLPAGTRCP